MSLLTRVASHRIALHRIASHPIRMELSLCVPAYLESSVVRGEYYVRTEEEGESQQHLRQGLPTRPILMEEGGGHHGR